jgi:hypothetical protein
MVSSQLTPSVKESLPLATLAPCLFSLVERVLGRLDLPRVAELKERESKVVALHFGVQAETAILGHAGINRYTDYTMPGRWFESGDARFDDQIPLA